MTELIIDLVTCLQTIIQSYVRKLEMESNELLLSKMVSVSPNCQPLILICGLCKNIDQKLLAINSTVMCDG